MHFSLITCGLPGPAYHGGAVTCWAIIKSMIAKGHQVTVLSLFDISEGNPYLDSRETQSMELYELGAGVEFIELDFEELSKRNGSSDLFDSLREMFNNFFIPDMEKFFPWVRLQSQVEAKLKEISPDAIFCYHFDALSALYSTNVAPVMAGVGDLWHLPIYFRWKAENFSLKKYIIGGLTQLSYMKASESLMTRMLKPCAKSGAFAAHYAEWLRSRKDLPDVLYLRTPAHDPAGEKWRDLKDEYTKGNSVPRILMIGDITGTAARYGLRLLVKDVLPALEKRLGPDGFEIHLVGGGKIDDEFRTLYDRPYVKIKGRIVPPDKEFLCSDILFVPTPVTLGIRVRIITAMSYGCCIITHEANTAGIPEVIHNENALISKTGAGLAREILKVLENNKLRYRLEGNARSTFEKYFSEETAAARIVDELVSI